MDGVLFRYRSGQLRVEDIAFINDLISRYQEKGSLSRWLSRKHWEQFQKWLRSWFNSWSTGFLRSSRQFMLHNGYLNGRITPFLV